MHEVITLQFGEASNYLGTHFWNAQVLATLFLVSYIRFAHAP